MEIIRCPICGHKINSETPCPWCRENEMLGRQPSRVQERNGSKTCGIVALAVALLFLVLFLVNGARTAGNSAVKDRFGNDNYYAWEVARQEVAARLKAPSTADFCEMSESTISLSGDTWTVRGYLDAQNSFGAPLRNSFTVIFTATRRDHYQLDQCNIG